MSRRSGKCGVRLASFLVVVASIVVLFTLVLPAIRDAREAARRNQCSDNLRQIATALASYHDTHGMFPMGAMHSGPNPGGEPPVTAGLGPSWWFGLLPLMDQHGGPKVRVTEGSKGITTLIHTDEQMYLKIIESQGADQDLRCEFNADDVDRYLRVHPYTMSEGQYVGRLSVACMWPEYMRCPTSPTPPCEDCIGPILLPNYVGIAGGCDIDPGSEDYRSGWAPPDLTPHEPRVVFRNSYKGTGAAEGAIVTSSGLLPPCQHVKLQDCTDGVSNTMIVAEQSDWLCDRDPASTTRYHGDPGWTQHRGPDGRWLDAGSDGGWLSGTRRVDPVPRINTLGGPPSIWGADCWNITTVRYPPNFKRVMGATPLPGCSENHGINNPLHSPHPSGLQVAMADGSVRFISEKTTLEVLLRLAIRNDGGDSDQHDSKK